MNRSDEFNVLVIGENAVFEIPGTLHLLNSEVSIHKAIDPVQAGNMLEDGWYQLVLIFQQKAGESWEPALEEWGHYNRLNAQIILYSSEISKMPVRQLLDTYPQLLNVLAYPRDKDTLSEHISTHLIYWNKLTNLELQVQNERSKRQQAENEQVKSRLLFENIIHKSDAGILLIDNEGIIRFANKAAEKIFLRQSDELVGRPFGMMANDHENTEIEIVRRSGEIGIGVLSISDTEWKDKPARLVLINDITEYKNLLEKYEKAKKKAEESDRLKTAFLANMSHEIRTPMNAIVGFAQLLKDGDIDEGDHGRYLDIIVSSGDHLLTLINDILDIAKIEAGELDVTYTPCNLVELMREVYNTFMINPRLQEKDIRFSLQTSTYDELFILIDTARIKQVLMNLISNALKFTFEGFVEFGFRVLIEDQKILFFVKDTGVGIPEKEHQNIFQRFRKLEPDSNEQLIEGAGIGLAISKSMVHLMGGEIWVYSKEGEGSTFSFTVPYLRTNPGMEKKSLRNADEVRLDDLLDKRLLIVEDSETNYMLLSSVLKKFNMHIFWARNGWEAVNICKREQVDLVLMDIKLPVLNGYEATQQIKAVKPALPVIAQTAYAMGEDKDKCLAAGCDDYIEKPLNINVLLEKMTHFMG